MIKIYKPSGSMRSNYRPLEFLICLGLTLGCLWSSTFIKSSMWLGWLIGMGLRLSPNTIAAQTSRTRLFFFVRLVTNSIPCRRGRFRRFLITILYPVIVCICTNANLSFSGDLSQISTCYTQWKIGSLLCILIFSLLVVFPIVQFSGAFGRAVSCWACTFVKAHSPVKELEASKVIARFCHG